MTSDARTPGTAARPLRVIVAPDSFKGSISAHDAADAIVAGWRAVRPHDEVVLRPQADGGEGTLDAIEAATPGSIRRDVGPVTGPDGRPVPGQWLALPDGTAVIEMAQMSGLPLMSSLDSVGATSRGLGEVMARALDDGAERLLIGLGGSASTDAGLPVLAELGERRPPRRGALVLTDVTAPLFGPRGAAAVFGPQKGASPTDVEVLDQRLRRAADRLGGDPEEPGAGAAGGVGFALRVWGADLTSGAAFIAEATGLTALLASADIVLTGEGRFDAQSLTGKVVGSILAAAEAHGVTPGLIVGTAALTPSCWHASLADIAPSTEAALREPARWLHAAAERAAHELG